MTYDFTDGGDNILVTGPDAFRSDYPIAYGVGYEVEDTGLDADPVLVMGRSDPPNLQEPEDFYLQYQEQFIAGSECDATPWTDSERSMICKFDC